MFMKNLKLLNNQVLNSYQIRINLKLIELFYSAAL